ncbi:MAG: hypothetical protein HRU09_19530 [Oligoflexales bacterium]|nr:hypothetical protein [Oligoflexales bacterium]
MNKTMIQILLFGFIANLIGSACQQKTEVKNFRQGPSLRRKMTGEQSWKLTCTKNKEIDSSFQFDTWSDERISLTGDYYQIEDQEFSDPECKNLLLTHRQLGVVKNPDSLGLTQSKLELEAWRHFVIPNAESPRYQEIKSFLEKQCGISIEGKLVLDIEDDDCESWFEEDFEQVLTNQPAPSGQKQAESFQLATGAGAYIYHKEKPRAEIDESKLLSQ